MSDTLWTCEKCGSVMTTGSIASHAEWHDKQRDIELAGLRMDGIGPTHGIPIDQTRPLPPSIPPQATLIDRLAALSTWLGEFPFQPACVTGERTINDAIGRIEELEGEAADAEDAQAAVDTLIGHGVDALARLGLSKVPDAGSLKRDEAWDAVKIMEAAIVGQRERIAYLEELNRRLERYAAFDADGYVGQVGDKRIVVECKNCGHHYDMKPAQYEQLQRQTHERNWRIDL